MKRLTALASATAVLLTLTACSSNTGGFATSSTTSSTTASDSNGGSSASTSTASSGGKIGSADQLANTQACSLLTTSEATSLGLSSTGTTNNAGAKSGCEWDGSDLTAGVLIRTDVGLAGVVPNGTLTSTTVGSHQAKKLVNAPSCMYIIGITDSMRVDVQAVPSSSGDGCQQALALAQIIEPKLP